MNFWSGMFRFPPMQSAIDLMLQRADCTIEKLMDDEDFSQELRTNNDLIDFCCEDDTLQRIVQYTIRDYPQDLKEPLEGEQKAFMEKIASLSEEEKAKQIQNCPFAKLEQQNEKYHIVCSSIFGDEPGRISETIAQKTDILLYLFKSLKEGRKDQMNSIGLVLLSCAVQVEDLKMYEILMNDDSLLELMLERMEVNGILDTLLQLMKLDDAEKNNFMQWIIGKGFITRILSVLMEAPSIDTIGNVSAFIHNMVLWKVSCADSPALEFLNAFNVDEKLPEFVEHVFQSDNTYLVEQAFRIISNILACSTILTYSNPNELPGIFKALQPHISKFEVIFKDSTRRRNVVTNLVFIILSLVLCGFDKIYVDLCNENVFSGMMYAFYDNHNCSILRQTIQMTVNSIFNGQVDNLKMKFLEEGKMLKTMIEKDQEADQIKKEKNLGPDYWIINSQMMVQIFRSCEEKEEDNEIYKLVVGNTEFAEYITQTILARDVVETEYFGGNNDGDISQESDEYDVDDVDDDDNFPDEDDDDNDGMTIRGDDEDDDYDEEEEDDGIRIREVEEDDEA